MADITNSEAIAFVNEQVRPLCEEARALKARIAAATTRWYGGLNQAFPNTADPVQDGREAEGVSRLTGAHVNSAMGVLIASADQLNGEIIERPCVRAIEVN